MAEIGELDAEREIAVEDVELALDALVELPGAAAARIALIDGVSRIPFVRREAGRPNGLRRRAHDLVWADLLEAFGIA